MKCEMCGKPMDQATQSEGGAAWSLCEDCMYPVKYQCTRCGSTKQVEERYSFGVYAGRLCRSCAMGYSDHCGIDQPQGDWRDLELAGERYWEEE